MTLNGAIKQLHELRSSDDMPVYFKPAIAEVIITLLMDAEEKRRGKWIDSGKDWLNCSVCDEPVRKLECDNLLRNDSYYHYCPNCGAKMEG